MSMTLMVLVILIILMNLWRNIETQIVTKASILVRLGIYIGTHFFSNSKIDILSGCNADIDRGDRSITKDPPVASLPFHV